MFSEAREKLMRYLSILLIPSLMGCSGQHASRPENQVVAGAVPPQLTEASGVARDDDSLVFVSDATPDVYFRYGLRANELPRGSGPILSFFTVDQTRLVSRRLFTSSALDLEGIAVATQGPLLLVSETMRSLLTPERFVTLYPNTFAETGNRGIEGVALRRTSDTSALVAVLWEGGFLERGDLLRQFEAFPGLVKTALKPVICVHTISLPAARTNPARPCRTSAEVIELQVPIPPDTLQRFRAPDLVWLPNGDGFLVLLSSQNATTSPNVEYKYKWLQRFDRAGSPIGNGLNLCPILPPEVQGGASGNLEGLGWFEEGKSVIMVNDFRTSASVVIVAVSDAWPSSSTERCP